MLQALLLTACGGSPLTPQTPPISLTLPPQVTGTVVRCETCGAPTTWGTATASIVITNHSDRDRVTATVETTVVNRSRATVLGRNTRPNPDAPYPETRVPANGSLTLDAAVVYEPLPPPRDEIWFVVLVTFDNGASVRSETRLFTPGL